MSMLLRNWHMYRQYAISAKEKALQALREAEKEAAARVPRIDAIVGEPLRNINIFVDKTDPIARPDEEYPAWLRLEMERPAKLDPYRFQKLGILPTRTELRLINKAKIRRSNEERGA